MKQLQSREFREQMNALAEPVEVYARAELKGTWYPAGMSPEAPVQTRIDEPPVTVAALAQIHALEDEVKRLKQLLAERTITPVRSQIRQAVILDAGVEMSDRELKDWLGSLPEQDRAYFAAKLGVKSAKK